MVCFVKIIVSQNLTKSRNQTQRKTFPGKNINLQNLQLFVIIRVLSLGIAFKMASDFRIFDYEN